MLSSVHEMHATAAICCGFQKEAHTDNIQMCVVVYKQRVFVPFLMLFLLQLITKMKFRRRPRRCQKHGNQAK